MFRLVAIVLAILLAPVAAEAECLLKPNLGNKNGYWRYHVDRQTHRHCWYLSHSKARPARHGKSEASSVGTAAPASVTRDRPAGVTRRRAKPESASIPQQKPVSASMSQQKPESASTADAQEPSPTAAYLVDDAWNVIGLEQAPPSMVQMVDRLRHASGSASVAWSMSAPVIPVQEALLTPLVQQTPPTAPGQARALTIAALWLALTAGLMWWLKPRRRAISQVIASMWPRKRTPPVAQNQIPAVATDLRLLTQAVSAHFEAEDERLRTERRVVMRQRRSG